MAKGSVCGQQRRRTVLERHLVESVKSERLESGCGGIGRVCVGRDLVKDSWVVLQCRFEEEVALLSGTKEKEENLAGSAKQVAGGRTSWS